MATPQTQANPPSAQDQGRAARGAALAAVAATALPGASAAVGATATAVGGALTVTQITQATTALLTALRRFQQTRGQAFDEELRTEALKEQPTLGDVIDNIISRELGFEATFRAKQYDRVQGTLGPALAIQDAKEREQAIRMIFERERRYTQMREEAMRVRVMAAIRHFHLEQASPQGAYWVLGQGVKQHTLDCLAMANQFWPWSVLHAFQPPVHHGCACALLSLNEAVGKGLMAEDQIPDEMAAVRHATDVLRKAADAMRRGEISEADIALYLTGLRRIEEVRWEDRFAKGTEHGGEFRPRFGGDPGTLLYKRLGLGARGKVMHDLLPSVKPLKTSDRGNWTWVGGSYVRIPQATEWRRQIKGVAFHSPAGTTNVYRDGKLLATPQTPTERREVLTRVSASVNHARMSLTGRRGAPLREGDGPAAVLSMEGRGFEPHRVVPFGPGAWRISYHASTGANVEAVVSKTGRVQHAEWDAAPIPAVKPRRSALAPKSFAEHARDAMAWADELGRKYGSTIRLTGVESTNMLEDHAGLHEHSGGIYLGRDVQRDIDRAGAARSEGVELTGAEKRGVWASYWSTAHEVAHAVNPIKMRDFEGANADLEEALTEESAHRLAVERLAAQGQHDVLRWRDRHPNELAVRGVYAEKRGALADILDAAAVPANERAAVIESLKFQVDPRRRFEVLGAMIKQAHPEISGVDGERWAREKMVEGGSPRAAAPMSPGLVPKGVQRWIAKHEPWQTSLFGTTAKATPAPKPPPMVIGGMVPEPVKQGPIPSFEHIPLELHGKAFNFDGMKARGEGKDWIVREHAGDKNRVAEELLANAVYRALGVNVPVMGHVETPGSPDFGQINDALVDEPPLPDTNRLSTGVILRAPNGRVTLIEPRNHYGGYVHTFPKGGLEAGLTPQQNALKELWEETGLHARITGVVGDFKGDTGITRYYVGVLTGGEPTPSDETQAINTVSVKDAAEMLNKPRDKEVLAAVAKAGVPKGKYPDVFPPTVPGSGVAFQVPEGKKFDAKQPSPSLSAGYMADALLGNWDVVGKWGDNVRWQGENGVVRLNHGSAFDYRPGGESKDYGAVPEEVWSLLYRGQAAGLVQLDEDQMRAQARQIAASLPPARVKALVAAAPFRDAKTRKRIAGALTARVAWMRRFGDGEIDLPEPAEGAEARGLHQDAQRKFPVYPEEEKALAEFLGPKGRLLDDELHGGKGPSDESVQIAKRLDGMLNDARTTADTYAYVGFDGDIGKGMVGQTVKQKSFTLAHTDRAAVEGKSLVRVLLPGGSHAFHMADGEPGAPDMLLARGARMRFTQVAEGGDGRTQATAILMPYERPLALMKPWGPPGKASVGKIHTGDKVTMGSGVEGKVTYAWDTPGGKRKATVAVGGKQYTVPAETLTKLTKLGKGMASPGTTATVSPNGLEMEEAGHRWRIEKRPLMKGHPELRGMTDGTVIAHYPPGESTTHNFRYVASRGVARGIFRRWQGLEEAWSPQARAAALEVRKEHELLRPSEEEPHRLGWHEPPRPTGVPGERKGGGLTAVGVTNTVLGDAVEHALRDHMGFEDAHPGRRQGPFDVKYGSHAYEVKAVSRSASEYKAKPKKLEVEGKLAHARANGLTPHTMIVVYDPEERRIHAYSKPGVGAYRLTSEKAGWRYHGSVPLDLGNSHDPAAQMQEALVLLAEADTHHTGVMVALYPHPATAKKFALPGGDDPDSLHVTLAFLGHKDEQRDPEKLKATVRDWAARTAPLSGEVSGHGIFTAGPDPVTYLSPDLPGLPAARQDLVDALKRSGHPANAQHGYSPHMTLDYADRADDLPDHGGHKLRFKRAVLKIGDEKHSFPFGGESDG